MRDWRGSNATFGALLQVIGSIAFAGGMLFAIIAILLAIVETVSERDYTVTLVLIVPSILSCAIGWIVARIGVLMMPEAGARECPACGYDLRGGSEGNVGCPECGWGRRDGS